MCPRKQFSFFMNKSNLWSISKEREMILMIIIMEKINGTVLTNNQYSGLHKRFHHDYMQSITSLCLSWRMRI